MVNLDESDRDAQDERDRQRFLDFDPNTATVYDPPQVAAATAVRTAFSAGAPDSDVTAHVRDALSAGVSWSVIGALLGMGGEEARQRFDT